VEEDFSETLDLQGIKSFYPQITTTLKGKWQHLNVSLALAAAEILSPEWTIKEEHIREGIAKTRWPGRLELIGKNPLFILDGAHNPQAARMLREELSKFKKDRNINLIFGVLREKDRAKIIPELFRLAEEITLIAPKSRRAVDTAKLKVEGKAYNKNVKVSENLTETIRELKQSKGRKDVICICGSLYLVGEARGILLRKKGDLTD